VKQSKRAKKNKPAEEPVLAEPELRMAAPDVSVDESPAVPSPDATTAPTIEQAMGDSENPEIPSPAHPDDPDVEITDYAHLRIEDIVSGYVSQVHNSRDLEINMVKQIQQKSEV